MGALRVGNWGRGWLGPVAVLALTLAACSPAPSPSPSPTSTPSPVPSPATMPIRGHEAVVIVSGLATQTPYTSAEAACTSGLAAGNTASEMREKLVGAGQQVFTAPTQIGPGQVTESIGVGPSADCPPPLPERMTIDTTQGIDQGGVRLAAFLVHLKEEYGINRVHLVGHSMGGLFARAAIGDVKASGRGIRFRSLTTLSVPWTGTFPADYATGALPLSACGNEPVCQQVLTDYQTKLAEPEGPDGAASVITTKLLQGRHGWNVSQGDDLRGIPVTLIAGDHYRLPGGDPQVWPNDAVVSRDSGLARGLAGAPVSIRTCLVRPDVHTIGLAEQAGLPWTSAITWDPVVMDAVLRAVEARRPATSSHC